MNITTLKGAKNDIRFNYKRLNALLSLALWLVFGTGPAIILLAGFIFGEGGIDPDAWPNMRRLGLLFNSAALAVGVGVFCTTLSLLAVSALQKFVGGRFGWLLWLPMILISVPPFVHATAWMEAGHLINLAAASFKFPSLSMPNWFSVLWVQCMSFLPVTFGFCLAGMNRIEGTLTDAGRVCADDWRLFRAVIVPLAFPVIMVGSGLVALMSLTNFSIPALFQMPSYGMEIYVTYSAGAGEKTVFLLALPLLSLYFIVILFLLHRIRRTVVLPGAIEYPPPLLSNYPSWFKSLQLFSVLVLVLQIVIPLIMLLSLSISPATFIDAALSAKQEIGSSLLTASAAAVGSVFLGLLLFTRLRKTEWLLLCLLPLVFPATLTGIGLIKLWNHPQTALIYGGFPMPVLASIARFSPICVLVLHYYDNAVARELVDAARLFRGDGLAKWLRILLPLYKPGLIVAFLIVFALALGELPATLLVAPPGYSTISIRIYNLLHYGGSQSVASLCLIITAASMVAAALFFLTMAHWKSGMRRWRINP